MLTKEVTAFFPTNAFVGAVNVGIHLKLTDDSLPLDQQVVIDTDFTEVFTQGQGMTGELKLTIGKRAQAAIDSYKQLKSLFDSEPYKTARAQIDNGINV